MNRLLLTVCLSLLGVAWTLDCLLAAPLAAQEPSAVREGAVPETILPYEPIEPRTEKDKQRLDATAHYMNGLVLEKRGNYQEAMQEYRKALAADPEAVEVYRSTILLAIRFNQINQAQMLLAEALKRAPDDFQFLRLLGAIRQDARQIPQAIEAFEKAVNSPEVDKSSQDYVLLMMQLGLLYRTAEETEKAADAYQVIFEAVQNPDRFRLSDQAISLIESNEELSYERIGSVFLEAKRFDSAMKAFELAQQNPRLKTEEIRFFKAQILEAQEKYEQALVELQPYLDKHLQSQGVAPYRLLVEIMKGLDREDEIEEMLDKLYDDDAQNNYIVYALADLYREQNKQQKAIDLYLKAIGRGADPEGYQGLMDIYYSQKKADEWLGALSGLLGLGRNVDGIEDQFKQVSNDKEFMDELVKAGLAMHESGSRKFNYPEAWILGRLAAAAKRTDDVIQFFQLAMEYRRSQTPQLSAQLADYLIQQKEFVKAESLIEKALENPSSTELKAAYGQILAQILMNLSYELEEAGKREEALQKMVRANEVLPNNTFLTYRLAWLEYRNDHLDRAVEIYESLIGTTDYMNIAEPTLRNLVRQSHFMLSAILVQQGQIQKGQEILEKIYENEPDDPSVNNDLGYLYADQNIKLEQAEKMIRIALDAEPDNNAYLDSMGWVLYRLGKYEEAKKYLLKAVEGSTEGDSTLWDHLGDVYDKSGAKEQAVDAWKTALKQAEADTRRDEKLIRSIRGKLGLETGEQPIPAPKPAGATTE